VQIVLEFQQRAKVEDITMKAFAAEKGITYDQMKKWSASHPSDLLASNMERERNRTAKYPDVEREVAQWLSGLASFPPNKEIKERAREVAGRLKGNHDDARVRERCAGFTGSDGWLEGFLNRYSGDGTRAIASAEDNHDDDQTQVAHGDTAAAAAAFHGEPHREIPTGRATDDVAAGGLTAHSHDNVEHSWSLPALPPLPPVRLPPPSLPSSPPAVSLLSRATRPSPQQVCIGRAGEVAIGERLQLVDEFQRRKQGGEAISMAQFAQEKHLSENKFKNWFRAIKQQREDGREFVDPERKRNRQPRYREIEDELRQWMAGHDDPTSIPSKDMKAKALEVADRLVTSGFVGFRGFKASDTWISAFRRRYQQPGRPMSSAAASPPSAVGLAIAVRHDGVTHTGDSNQQSQPSAATEQVVIPAPLPSPAPPMHPPHPHPLPTPLWVRTRIDGPSGVLQDQVVDEAAAVRMADGFISRDSNQPLDQQSQHSWPNTMTGQVLDQLSEQWWSEGCNTMSIAPSKSRLTNERPPNKIHKTPTRSHREDPPSVVWSRSSVNSAVNITGDERLSDIPDDDDCSISTLSTCATTEEMPQQTEAGHTMCVVNDQSCVSPCDVCDGTGTSQSHRRVLHGTDKASADRIRAVGFNPSCAADDDLQWRGVGIYVTNDMRKATRFAKLKSRKTGSPAIVVTLIVDLGKLMIASDCAGQNVRVYMAPAKGCAGEEEVLLLSNDQVISIEGEQYEECMYASWDGSPNAQCSAVV